MSVKIGGKSFETLDDKIYVGGHKVTKIYAGRKLVYPVRDEETPDMPHPYRFWWKWPYSFVTEYGPRPVNTIGFYLTLTKYDIDVHKAALYCMANTYSKDLFSDICFTNVYYLPYRRKIYAIRYAGLDDEIIYDFYNQYDESTLPFSEMIGIFHQETGKTYYTLVSFPGGAGLGLGTRTPDGIRVQNIYTDYEWGASFNGAPVAILDGIPPDDVPWTDAINYVLDIN